MATAQGKLKVILGYAAGVGKTYKMLEEGQRLESEGRDVVIGYFEPHGRKDTIAKTEGLEMVLARQSNTEAGFSERWIQTRFWLAGPGFASWMNSRIPISPVRRAASGGKTYSFFLARGSMSLLR